MEQAISESPVLTHTALRVATGGRGGGGGVMEARERDSKRTWVAFVMKT